MYVRRRQQQQQQQQRQRSDARTEHQKVATAATIVPSATAPKGGADDWMSGSGAMSCSSNACASSMCMYVKCPRCNHNFNMIDHMWLNEGLTSQSSNQQLTAPTCSMVLTDQTQLNLQPGYTDQYQQPASDEAPKEPKPRNQPKIQGSVEEQKLLSPPQTLSDTQVPSQPLLVNIQTNNDGIYLVSSNSSPHSWSQSDIKVVPNPGNPENSGAENSIDSSLGAEIVRNYQIVNTTIEQLERVIADKNDRRIRKIASMSGCSIDLRSELPLGRFRVIKNFCVIRSLSDSNIDCCRCMLSRQMGWDLVAKPTY